jgi:MFS transporter, ACS family, D-galactonate transporter
MTLEPRGAAASGISRPDATASARIIVALLFFFMLINFADKVVLALAAVPLMDEFALTPTQFGLLGSSFFFLFAIAAVTTGFVVNRASTRWTILVMAIIWSVAQLSIPAASGLGFLMMSRIVLGAGEGPAYPVALHAVYKWFSDVRRSLPTAVIAAGACVGLIVAPPALAYVITHLSWRWAFGVLGVLGLLWALAWLALGAEGEITEPKQSSESAQVPYARLLFNGTTLATFASGFGGYWGSTLIFTWFTPYLIKGLGFPLSEAGWLTTVPALAMIVAMGAGAYVSQVALAHGARTRVARGILAGAAALLGGLFMLLTPHVATSAAKVTMISLGIALPTIIGVAGFPIISEFTPVRQRSAMLAITNSIWTTAGLFAPYLTGRLIESGATTEQGYEHGFVICGVITSVCGAIGLVFLRPEAELMKFSGVGAGSHPRGSFAREVGHSRQTAIAAICSAKSLKSDFGRGLDRNHTHDE